MTFSDASAYDVLWADAVVVEQGALTGDPAPDRAEVTHADQAKAAKSARTSAKKAAQQPAGKAAKGAKAAKKVKKAPAKKPAGAKHAPSKREGKPPARKKKET
jgi:sRNA-binding protein